MATLEKIRNRAGLLVFAVGVALFAFILTDFLNSGSSYFRDPQDLVADVDGTPINLRDYQNRIEEMTNVYKMQPNAGNLTDEINNQIRQTVYDGMVQEIVLKNELDKLGISITPEELFDMIQGDNISPMVQQFPFFVDPQTGAFNKTRALSILKAMENIEAAPAEQREQLINMRNYWLFWERNIKFQRLQDKYTNLLSKAIVANPLDAKNSFDEKAISSDIVFVMQPYTTIADSLVQVSDSELKKLYKQRKGQFKQKESRVIDYISIDIRPSEEDYNQIRTDIERVKNELIASDNPENVVNDNSEVPFMNAYVSDKGLDEDMTQFVATAEIGAVEGPIFRNDTYRLLKLLDKKMSPDSVKVSHILLASQDGNNDVFIPLADSLMGVLKNGENFQELAAKYSVDQSGQTGGEMGWFTEAGALRALGIEFKDLIFSSEVNEVKQMKSSYGIHLFKVTEKTVNVPKYKLAYVQLTVNPSSKTYTKLYNDLSQFASVNNTSEKMEQASKDAGYNFVKGVTVTSSDHVLGSMPGSRPIIRWAFNSKKNKELSEVFECTNHFVVAIRDKSLPEGYQSLESVAPVLKTELIAQKKGEEIARNLKSKSITSLSEYAQVMNSPIDTVRFINMNTPRITGIGIEPIMNAKVTYAPLNQLSEPVIGKNGVYVFNVFNRSNESGQYSEEREIMTLESANSYKVGYQSIQWLVDQTKIKDNRIRFD